MRVAAGAVSVDSKLSRTLGIERQASAGLTIHVSFRLPRLLGGSSTPEMLSDFASHAACVSLARNPTSAHLESFKTMPKAKYAHAVVLPCVLRVFCASLLTGPPDSAAHM